MPTITEESWNLHIEQEPNFLSTPTPTEWRIQIFKITGGRRSSRPWDRGGGGGAGFQKRFFPPFGPQFGVKIRDQGTRPPRAPPLNPPLPSAPWWATLIFHVTLQKMRTSHHIMRQGHIPPHPPPPPPKQNVSGMSSNLRNFFSPANLIFSPTTFTYILFSTERFLFNCSFSIWVLCYYYFTNSIASPPF